MGLLTNFPNGIYAPNIWQPLPYLVPTGAVFWVSNSTIVAPEGIAGSNGNDGQSPATPFATIDFAVGKCVAGRGDIIYVMPGHVETVSSAGLLSLDVAGIKVIGLGSGESRPKINFTTVVGADMNVDAANITVANILFTGGIDALTGPIDVNAADFKLIDCEWRDVTGQATDVIVTDATCTRLLIDGLIYDGATAAGTNSGIVLNGSRGAIIRNVIADGNFAVGFIDVRTVAATDIHVYNVRFRTRNSADIFLIDTITGSTGTIGPNLYLRLQDNAANITEAITGATFVQHQDISVVNFAGEIGMPINTTASTDA